MRTVALSRLGYLAYKSYWAHTIARTLLSKPTTSNAGKTSSNNRQPLTIRELSDETYILPDDIVSTLQSMQVLERVKCKKPPNSVGATSVGDGDDKDKVSDDTVPEEDQANISRPKLQKWAAEHKVSMTPPVDVAGFIERSTRASTASGE
jgi:hypothetical protein